MTQAVGGGSTRHVLALDLKDDEEAIATYERYHQAGRVWSSVLDAIEAGGILEMTIYRVSNRLVMILDVLAEFSFARKATADAANPSVIQWERLMDQFQQPLPGSAPDEKWRLMTPIFTFAAPSSARVQ